jgi:uncharacterized protein (TIGR03083 family)
MLAPMTTLMHRTDIAQGLLDEYGEFVALVADLNEEEWSAPTRCTGFEVRDVAGHVIGLAEDVVKGVPGTRNAEEEAASVRGDTPAQAAARLRAVLDALTPLLATIDDAAWDGPSGVPDLTFGRGVLTLWYDAYVHADDIRAALNRPSQRGAGLRASVEYLAGELETKGSATTAPAGGDELQFVLVATGRADAASIGLDPSINIYA